MRTTAVKCEVEQPIDFGTNVWYGATLDKLKSHLIEQIDIISSYPEKDAKSLRRLLARRYELKDGNLIVTSGTFAAVNVIARIFDRKKSLFVTPCGRKLVEGCEASNHEIVLSEDVNSLLELDFTGIDLCWMANPNTVSGKQYRRKEILDMVDKHPEVTFIFNITYSNYVLDDLLKPSDIGSRKNMIMFSSVSKSYNLPGLRLAYIVAPDSIGKLLQKQVASYSISTVAQEAGKYIFVHPAQFVIPLRKWLRNAEEFRTTLAAIPQIEVLPSSTPYFLIKLNVGEGGELARFLLEKYNINIRTAEDICSLDSRFIGVSTRSQEENNLLVGAIQEWIESKIG
ncbi:MAG: aminotransferase class I/II-fold pyridoxal phosphate-dependent enzyme [Porphyromonas sp.]|nr:aminotransferase class I/II-fold pyridoxal phosphate-dependent enzyme [Porphyromonas sp.]